MEQDLFLGTCTFAQPVSKSHLLKSFRPPHRAQSQDMGACSHHHHYGQTERELLPSTDES